MDGTILSQGTFTQGTTAVAQTIVVPSGTDFLNVYNYTQASGTAGNGYKFYWQLGMGTTGIVDSSGTAHAVSAGVTVANAFVIYNPNSPTTYSLNNGSTGVTGFTAANPAVVTVGATTGMPAGTVVRFTSLNTNQSAYNGIEFSVGYGTLTGTTFSVDYLNSTGSTPATAGNFRVIGFPVMGPTGLGIITSNGLFYPRTRYITNISAAASAVITLSVQHNYSVGQEIRLSLPGGTAVWGDFANLDNYSNTNVSSSTTPNSYIITAVDNALGVGHNTITINANTTGFGVASGNLSPWYPVFAVPLSAFTQAQVVPFGEDTATALAQVPPLSSLGDSVQNVGFLGMTLSAGALLPAGVASDVVYWQAGKSSLGGS
jgi:hypothetical protein